MIFRRSRDVSRTRGLTAASLVMAFLILPGRPLAGVQAKSRPKDLAGPYQEWLKVADYLIKDKERDVFLRLTSDRDRDLFIEAFWKLRDPTPGTPENEFQTEHMKRFNEANRRYRFGSVREGWMTDRGRMYIILGPPRSTAHIPGDMTVFPAEIWSYYGDPGKGMPVHFELVFYQYKNAGEYKLYDPAGDGPARLLVNGLTDYRPSDYQSMYRDLFDKQPDLARVAFSIIPGEIPAGYQPSLESTLFMAAILESPKKGLDETYATHFLNFKGIVSTEYLTNYMASEGQADVVFDPALGLFFCDFAVAPERLSVDYYVPKEEYSSVFQVDVSLRAGDKLVLQYGKEFPVTIPKARLEDTQGTGLAVADSFPVIAGRYRLTVLLRNVAGKEFTVFEQDVEVPALEGRPRIAGPALGVKLSQAPGGTRLPFQVESRKLNPEPKGLFAATEEIAYQFSLFGLTRELLERGRVEILVKASSGDGTPRKSFVLPLDAQDPRGTRSFAGVIPAADFPPDFYDLELLLKDAQGETLDARTTHFIISPAKSLRHPAIAARPFSLANAFLYHYMLAHQYDRMDRKGEAEVAYRRAYALNPSYLQKVPDYADFLLRAGKPGDALNVVESLKDDSRFQFQYAHLRGRALLDLGRAAEAVDVLLAGSRIYNSDAGLLAALGLGYHKLGQKAKALEALRASLKLNPDQPEVEALIRELETNK